MKTVLFVDDEPYVLNALRRAFAESDLHCLFAASAEEALTIMQRETIWVVVSDNAMPGMMGVDLLARLKTLSPDTVRVMLTANADFGTALAAINRSEAFRFVPKPWQDEALQAVVTEGIQRYELLQGMRSGDEARYRALAQAVELKDPYTRGHCDRVADYACLLARCLDLGVLETTHLRHGCILHDCGKIGVPESLLNFPGRLSEADMELVRNHPVWGCDVAHQAQLPVTVQQVILHHHERFDGTGYPHGLAGEAIPLMARIAAIADVYDALTTDRPYRTGYPLVEVVRIMVTEMSGHFDPHLLERFLKSVSCPVGTTEAKP
jgi:response regulator RpfG family c-di-GMP phosphodiesterase